MHSARSEYHNAHALLLQVVRTLLFLHNAGIVHESLDPDQILVDPMSCDAKFIGFGEPPIDDDWSGPQRVHYKAPEDLLSLSSTKVRSA